MKKNLIFLLFMLIGAVTRTASAEPVTQQQALEIARTECSTPAQYFYMDDDDESSLEWKIFIDAAPFKNWEHLCYLISVPKEYDPETFPIPYTKEIRMTAPDGDFTLAHSDIPTPLDFNRRDPYVYMALPEDEQAIANSTYALIINGGINKMSNHRRYWNDCAFIYELLSGKSGIPKSQIFPLMADGADPAPDTRNQNGTFISQSLDLNYDGQPEIQLSASKANIQNTLQSILPDIGQDDHLLIFVVNGGGTVDSITESYINLWGTEKMYDYELAQLLTPFTAKKVNVSVVLGQSFAGGFIDNLASVGCVVCAACDVNESSSAISSGSYDEFLYHWGSAMFGRFPNMAFNNSVNANTNGDGFVSMWEAYNYALDNSGPDVLPQFRSSPAYIGEDLGLLHRARTNFIYIKDNDGDLGDEPNLTTTVYNQSPSIWVRNQIDTIEENQNPFEDDSETANVYVRIIW